MPLEYVNHLGTPIPMVGSNLLAEYVTDALVHGKSLSVVRMSDGEEKILTYCKEHPAAAPMLQFTDTWRNKYGVDGITCGDMWARLDRAATDSTFFAPDGGEEFFLKHFTARFPFAEIYFPHRWTRKQRQEILTVARRVLVINANPIVAQRIKDSFVCPTDIAVSFIGLSNWRQSKDVIRRASEDDAPLVFVSGGPASKYIIPEIAKQGKVVLDMGSGAPHFWCTRNNPTCGESCRAVARVE